jgi:hypothetical protein
MQSSEGIPSPYARLEVRGATVLRSRTGNLPCMRAQPGRDHSAIQGTRSSFDRVDRTFPNIPNSALDREDGLRYDFNQKC